MTDSVLSSLIPLTATLSAVELTEVAPTLDGVAQPDEEEEEDPIVPPY